MEKKKHLLAIIELGGYPNLLSVYQQLGYTVELVSSQRKARSYMKKNTPDVIVAEYNYQTDFRDRSSNLETLMAVLQRQPDVKLVVFYLPGHAEKFASFRESHPVSAAVEYPITADKVRAVLHGLVDGGSR